MYLEEKEANLLSGLIELELSKSDFIKLARSFEDKIKFNCSDEEIAISETLSTIIASIPKGELAQVIKSLRPDLSSKINNIID